MTLTLTKKWIIGKQFDNGGFGRVFHAKGEDGQKAAAKFVPKDPSATREMLFMNLEGVQNIVPVIDSGETDTDWVLVMPLAEQSLSKYVEENSPVNVAETIAVLSNILTALVDMYGKVVHRDIKPGNILLLNNKWCLADFGIARYVEATTSSNTLKHAMSAAYAAPERWRSQRATPATDVYAVGVIAYELIKGQKPFNGTAEELREQHLTARPPRLDNVPTPFADIVDEMLYKAPEARPHPSNILARLQSIEDNPPQIVIEALQNANSAEVERRSLEAIQKSEAQAMMDRRAQLQDTAAQSLSRISITLRDAITQSAPAAQLAGNSGVAWHIRLNQATLEFPPMGRSILYEWDWPEPPDIEVIATAEITLKSSTVNYGKEGRSHSLWFCDAKQKGQFEWFETGFMISPLIPRSTTMEPFSLEPCEAAAKALWPGMAEYQVAWPFTPLTGDNLTDFVQRWGSWFASTSVNGYQAPSQMPERETSGSWRR